ncbi:MAG: hypothetical protein IJC39_04275, partial [Firmicutes bacterium]|nr:hypothetical protein [Bacillota bacterium]
VRIKKSSGSSQTYDLSGSVTYTLDGSSSSWTKISDAFDDDDLYATLTLNANGYVTKLAATYESTDAIEGTLRELDANEVVIRKKDARSNTSYDLADEVKYYLDDETATRSELRDAADDYYDDEGDYLKVEIKVDSNNDVTHIYLFTENASGSSSTKKGFITSIDDSSSDAYIRFKETEDGSTKTYDLAGSVTYVLDGTSCGYSKIEAAVETADNNDELLGAKITLNSSNKVTKIEVNSIEGDSYSGYVSAMTDSEIFTFYHDNKSYVVVATGAKIMRDGSEINYATLKGLYQGMDSGKKMNLKIEFTSSISTSGNNTAKTIVLTSIS